MAHHPMFNCYIPPGERHRVVHARAITDITSDEVYGVTRAVFTAERMASLFSN
ncbi:MAG: hypothetical protein LC754_18630 [Acidobacteria bacterium]|nr:hypothetical protein [Acidobacteriota bacterium]